MKTLVSFLVAVIGFPVLAQGQYKIQSFDNEQILDMNGQILTPPESPTVGSSYGSIFSWGLENSETGDGFSAGLPFQNAADPFSELTLDGVSEFRGTDFADLVDPNFAPNDVFVTESLESLGVDPTTGRYILRLTVAMYTTANPNAAQWDSFEFDLRDPLDSDGDGETGSGPDGVFGTADDVDEPDGIFDTGDGLLDAPMPLDPQGLVRFYFCNDGDCGPNPPPMPPLFNPVSSGFSICIPQADQILPLAIYWILEDFDGSLADVDRDGQPGLGEFTGDFDSNGDGLLDSIRTDLIVPPPSDSDGNWTGTYILGFGNDDRIETTDELMSGNLRRIGFVIDFLSDVETEFGPLCGDVNVDGVCDLLDVAPFVNLIASGRFQIEGDINGDGAVSLLDVAGFVEKLLN